MRGSSAARAGPIRGLSGPALSSRRPVRTALAPIHDALRQVLAAASERSLLHRDFHSLSKVLSPGICGCEGEIRLPDSGCWGTVILSRAIVVRDGSESQGGRAGDMSPGPAARVEGTPAVRSKALVLLRKLGQSPSGGKWFRKASGCAPRHGLDFGPPPGAFSVFPHPAPPHDPYTIRSIGALRALC